MDSLSRRLYMALVLAHHEPWLDGEKRSADAAGLDGQKNGSNGPANQAGSTVSPVVRNVKQRNVTPNGQGGAAAPGAQGAVQRDNTPAKSQTTHPGGIKTAPQAGKVDQVGQQGARPGTGSGTQNNATKANPASNAKKHESSSPATPKTTAPDAKPMQQSRGPSDATKQVPSAGTGSGTQNNATKANPASNAKKHESSGSATPTTDATNAQQSAQKASKAQSSSHVSVGGASKSKQVPHGTVQTGQPSTASKKFTDDFDSIAYGNPKSLSRKAEKYACTAFYRPVSSADLYLFNYCAQALREGLNPSHRLNSITDADIEALRTYLARLLRELKQTKPAEFLGKTTTNPRLRKLLATMLSGSGDNARAELSDMIMSLDTKTGSPESLSSASQDMFLFYEHIDRILELLSTVFQVTIRLYKSNARAPSGIPDVACISTDDCSEFSPQQSTLTFDEAELLMLKYSDNDNLVCTLKRNASEEVRMAEVSNQVQSTAHIVKVSDKE